jgi:hypothetical protein
VNNKEGKMKTAKKTWAIAIVTVIVLVFSGSLTGELPKAYMAEPAQTTAEPTSEQIVAAATGYLKNLQRFSFESEIVEDVDFENGQMVKAVHNLSYFVKRPNKLRFHIEGDRRNRDWFYDGKTVASYDPAKNFYSRDDFPPTIDATLAKARDEYGLRLSIVAIASDDLYTMLMKGVDRATIVGLSRVEGTPCYQLLLEREQVNVQLWIQTGVSPLFRKVVITDKQEEGSPQWSAVLTKWNTSPDLPDAMFDFVPPKDAVKINFLKKSQTPTK